MPSTSLSPYSQPQTKRHVTVAEFRKSISEQLATLEATLVGHFASAIGHGPEDEVEDGFGWRSDGESKLQNTSLSQLDDEGKISLSPRLPKQPKKSDSALLPMQSPRIPTQPKKSAECETQLKPTRSGSPSCRLPEREPRGRPCDRASQTDSHVQEPVGKDTVKSDLIAFVQEPGGKDTVKSDLIAFVQAQQRSLQATQEAHNRRLCMQLNDMIGDENTPKLDSASPVVNNHPVGSVSQRPALGTDSNVKFDTDHVDIEIAAEETKVVSAGIAPQIPSLSLDSTATGSGQAGKEDGDTGHAASSSPSITHTSQHDKTKFNRDTSNRSSGKTTIMEGGDSSPIISERMELMSGAVILLNAIVLVAQYQWEGYISAVALKLEDGSGWPHAKPVFFWLEHAFNALYVLELFFRLYMWRCGYFYSLLNLFDASVVVISSLDLYVVQQVVGDGQAFGINTGVLRFFRLVKVVRALRIVRTIQIFADLRVLVSTMVSCIRSLFTGMMLLAAMMLVSGIIMCQSLAETIRDENEDPDLREWAWIFYGNAFRATYTMFEVTMSGCWPNYVRPLIKKFGPGYAIFFTFYVAFVVFAVIRLITAIFLKETMDAANADSEMVAAANARKKEASLNKLRGLFEEADESGDGVLDIHELEAVLGNARVKNWLQVLGLEVHETKSLFRLLDNGEGMITLDDFMKGIGRLKGQSRSIDVIAIQHEVDLLRQELSVVRMGFEMTFGVELKFPPCRRTEQLGQTGQARRPTLTMQAPRAASPRKSPQGSPRKPQEQHHTPAIDS